ncbi:MAG: hypothetical protein ACYCZF_17830 [Anaerolineae bacterium]
MAIPNLDYGLRRNNIPGPPHPGAAIQHPPYVYRLGRVKAPGAGS